MASSNRRQYHSFSPSPPGWGKETPGKPVPVNTFINPTVFVELFAGTVGIFIIAVLFWKLGKFLRSLTRHRVLSEGNSVSMRYARTWYGWVSVETHERNKAILRRMFKYIHEWLSWESPRTDYQWIWWDPGLEAMEEHQAKRKRLKLLPEFLKSYEVMPAMHTRYPRSSVECHGALVDVPAPEASRPTGLDPMMDDTVVPLPRFSFNEHRSENSAFASVSQESFRPRSRALTISSDNSTEGSLRVNNRLLRHSLTSPVNARHQPFPMNSSPGQRRRASWIDNDMPRMPRHSNLSFVHNSLDADEPSPRSSVHLVQSRSAHASRPTLRGENITSRKYRAWSAQMQMKAAKLAELHYRDSSGPPGTPLTALLASHLSEQSACSIPPATLKATSKDLQLPSAKLPLTARPGSRNQAKERNCAGDIDMEQAKFNTAPARLRSSKRLASLHTRSSNQARHSGQDECISVHPEAEFQSARGQFEAVKDRRRYATLPHFMDGCMDGNSESKRISVARLSDWEIRLIDQLSRKVVWIYNELTPGQKPYHFALLANHWLNRETWVVLDPPSRVSTDYRRRWGDPILDRHENNNGGIPKVKYSIPTRKRAHVPRIDSWRAAVNNQRRISGNRNAIRTITLYEDSADEPPDGHIDPACWILPKPPQGFEVSTKQRNAWYEGGAGWQETLEDWQQVRRGYHLQKLVHEGRANRNRVKEVASHVQRRCRTASQKLLPRETRQPRLASLNH